MHDTRDRGDVSEPIAPAELQRVSSNVTVVGLTDLLRQIHSDVLRVLNASICFFGAYDAAAQRVDVVWQVHNGTELPGGTFPLGSGLTSQVIRERRARLVSDWSRQGPAVQVQYATDRPDLPRSAITVPVVLGDRVLGVLSVQDERVDAFEPHHLELVQGIVDRAAPMIAASLLSAQAVDGVAHATPDLEKAFAAVGDAALALDTEGRLVCMNEGARRLLALGDHSVLFGFPVDRQQAGHWPLMSAELGEALRSVLDRVQRGEATIDAEIARGTGNGVVRCSAAIVLNAGHPAGAIMTFHAPH